MVLRGAFHRGGARRIREVEKLSRVTQPGWSWHLKSGVLIGVLAFGSMSGILRCPQDKNPPGSLSTRLLRVPLGTWIGPGRTSAVLSPVGLVGSSPWTWTARRRVGIQLRNRTPQVRTLTALMLSKVLLKMPACFRAANRTGKGFVLPLAQSHKAEAVRYWAALTGGSSRNQSWGEAKEGLGV